MTSVAENQSEQKRDPPRESVEVRADDVIGSYRIVGPLGAGGMGTVYRAMHATTGAAVAVKIAQVGDPLALESVRREIRLLGRIRHPGVVKLLEHGVHELRPWYAMELVEGDALSDRIAKIWRSEE